MHTSESISSAAAFTDAFPSAARARLLIFADQLGASQSIAFIEGLARARACGEVAVRVVEEAAFGPDLGLAGVAAARELAEAEMAEVSPTAIVLSRFGHGAGLEGVWAAARGRGLPVLVHIDDDLLDLPVTVGIERYRGARHPRRVRALRQALTSADLVIAATEALAERLAPLAGHGRFGWLENGAAGRPRPRAAKPENTPVVVGYMGSASHGPDLELVIPALDALLSSRRNVRVELFGSIARQDAADALPGAVVRRDAVAGDYAAFRNRLAELEWDIGLAPLRASPYNLVKTATKWTEYAEAGAAVLASDIEVYQPMFAWGAAAPAAPEQWTHMLERLVDQPRLRFALNARADELLAARFGWDRLEASVLGLLDRVRQRPAAA
jgi:glycosyltransferase involved in cell wall biosynthesis